MQQVIDINHDYTPSEVWRRDKERVIQVSANRERLALSTAVEKIQKHAPGVAARYREQLVERIAPTPGTGPAEDCDDFQLFTRPPFESEVVDVSAPTVPRVQQLAIDNLQSKDDRPAQFWPALVRMSSGTAVNATTMITTR